MADIARVVSSVCHMILFNPFMPSGLSYINSFDRVFFHNMGFWVGFYYYCFIEIPVFDANSEILIRRLVTLSANVHFIGR